jgi:hypothetical protein
MKPSARAAAIAVMLGTAVLERGAAQTVNFYFGNASTDTVIGVRPGVEARLPLRAVNNYCSPYYFCYYYTYSGRITFYYDPAKIEILGVQTGNWGVVDTSRSGPGSFTLNGQGYSYGYDSELLKLRVRLATGQTDGTYIWARADSAQVYYSYYGYIYAVGASAGIGEVCYATNLYGDVDADGDVDSRDALITLSAAVGLPVSGFNLALGDTDGDGLANSRDALMILSYAIGAPISIANRLGQGLPTSCAPLSSLSAKVVFRRQSPVYASDTLYLLENGVLAPIPNAAGLVGHPRLASDGYRVAYNCPNVYGYTKVCLVNTDGTGFVQYSSYDFEFDDFPDWSPDGLKLSFRSSGYPYTMDANGTNRVPRSSSGTNQAQVVWSPDGARLAFENTGVRIVDSNGTNEVTLATGASDPFMIRWNPAGDSLAFTRVGTGDQLWVVPAAGGIAQRVLTPATLGFSRSFDWGAPGFVFNVTSPGRSGLWYLPTLTSPIQRLTRGSDFDPAFRRNP